VLLIIGLFIVFIVCGISDDLDGYIARKYDMKSKLGTVLDVVADFLTFVCVMFITSVYTGNPITVISLGIGIVIYQKFDHDSCKKNIELSPVLNILTHIWIFYWILLSMIILRRTFPFLF